VFDIVGVEVSNSGTPKLRRCPVNRNIFAAATAALLAFQLASDGRKVARAFVLWEQRPSLLSALHVATSGYFLAEDVAALG
jgi:hypothetical protein